MERFTADYGFTRQLRTGSGAFIPSVGRGRDCPLLSGDRRGRKPDLCRLFLLAGVTGGRDFKGKRVCSGATGADHGDCRRAAGGFKRKEATIGNGKGETG